MTDAWNNDMLAAPRDKFILIWCPEDCSRWIAKWQRGEWFGVDDCGLSRSGGYHAGSDRVTGWEITHWQTLPERPE